MRGSVAAVVAFAAGERLVADVHEERPRIEAHTGVVRRHVDDRGAAHVAVHRVVEAAARVHQRERGAGSERRTTHRQHGPFMVAPRDSDLSRRRRAGEHDSQDEGRNLHVSRSPKISRAER